jgi:hypothetical protein
MQFSRTEVGEIMKEVIAEIFECFSVPIGVVCKRQDRCKLFLPSLSEIIQQTVRVAIGAIVHRNSRCLLQEEFHFFKRMCCCHLLIDVPQQLNVILADFHIANVFSICSSFNLQSNQNEKH